MAYMGFEVEKWGNGGLKAFVAFVYGGDIHVYGFRLPDTGWSSRNRYFISGLPLIIVPDDEILANLHGKPATLTVPFSNSLSEIEFSIFAAENDRNDALFHVKRVNRISGQIFRHQDGTISRPDTECSVSAPLRRVRPTELRYRSLSHLPFAARVSEI